MESTVSSYELRTPRTRLRTGVCKTLMPDAVASEAHQNDRSYVREVSGPRGGQTLHAPYIRDQILELVNETLLVSVL